LASGGSGRGCGRDAEGGAGAERGSRALPRRRRAGRLVWARCCHRGTTLYYGKVEERSIRCCYHGWLFVAEGRCLEQPCEPQGGVHKDTVRQPWYPVEERYGLVFAYMGPPGKKRVLPHYECLETLDEGEFIDADDSSIGCGGPQIVSCNWLQHFENVVDPLHVVVVHGTHSGPQFSEMMARLPDELWFERAPLGVRASSARRLPDGRVVRGSAEVALPTLRVVPNPRAGATGVDRFGRVESIGWTLPIDDAHFRIYVAGRRAVANWSASLREHPMRGLGSIVMVRLHRLNSGHQTRCYPMNLIPLSCSVGWLASQYARSLMIRTNWRLSESGHKSPPYA
jgi:nitrite reductase/ring-hydroxylating ferredoxin subunit